MTQHASTPDNPLADLEGQLAELSARAEAAGNRIAAIQPSATSADGTVTVSVSASGVLAGISFARGARDHDLDDLAALILRTAGQAHRTAALEAQQALVPLVGEDSAALETMREFLPPDEDETDEAPPVVPGDDPTDRSVPAAPRPVAEATAEDEDGFTGRGGR